jgi:hypothetical protein
MLIGLEILMALLVDQNIDLGRYGQGWTRKFYEEEERRESMMRRANLFRKMLNNILELGIIFSD